MILTSAVDDVGIPQHVVWGYSWPAIAIILSLPVYSIRDSCLTNQTPTIYRIQCGQLHRVNLIPDFSDCGAVQCTSHNLVGVPCGTPKSCILETFQLQHLPQI